MFWFRGNVLILKRQLSIIYADSINIVEARWRARFAEESLTFIPFFPFSPCRFGWPFWQFEWFWLSVIAFESKKDCKSMSIKNPFALKIITDCEENSREIDYVREWSCVIYNIFWKPLSHDKNLDLKMRSNITVSTFKPLGALLH